MTKEQRFDIQLVKADPISRTPENWRVTDTHSDSRIATCFDSDNARMVRDALNAYLNEGESEDRVCQEADGCPTEKAVLQRYWRETQPVEGVGLASPDETSGQFVEVGDLVDVQEGMGTTIGRYEIRTRSSEEPSPRHSVFDMAHEVIKELHRQDMKGMRAECDGAFLRIAPLDEEWPSKLPVVETTDAQEIAALRALLADEGYQVGAFVPGAGKPLFSRPDVETPNGR